MRAFEPPPDEEGAVEHVSASVVLAAVEESGPNYLLPKAPEPVKSRRKRLRVDATARQAGRSGDPRDGHASRDLRGGGEVVAGDHHGADGGHRRPARAPRPVHQLRGRPVLARARRRAVAQGAADTGPVRLRRLRSSRRPPRRVRGRKPRWSVGLGDSHGSETARARRCRLFNIVTHPSPQHRFL